MPTGYVHVQSGALRVEHAQEGSQHNDENAVIYQDSNMILVASPRQLGWLQETQVIVGASCGGFALYDDLKARRLQLRTELERFLDGDYTTAEFNKECYRFLGRMGNRLGIGPMSRKERREARSEDAARRRAAAGRQRILHGPVAVSGPEDSSSEEEEEEPEIEEVVFQSGGENQPDSDHDLFE